jgi:hypothetical protein
METSLRFPSKTTERSRKKLITFLLKAAVAVWGMDIFNEYLCGKLATV